MSKAVLAGVGTIDLIDPSTGEHIASSKTLVTSGIDFSLSAEEVRGGSANQLLAKYFHDSAMTFTLEDALFDLNYIALNTGSSISVGGDIMTIEQITTTVANQITVTDTPQPFLSLGTIGWYRLANSDEWTKITFEDKVASVTNLPVDSTICVKYVKTDETIDFFTVSSAFIPSQCYALLTLSLYRSGASESFSSSSKLGEVQVEIPNFLLDGAISLSLSSSGVATTSISGSALATFTGNEGCEGDGYYANLKQITFNKGEFDDVVGIYAYDSDIDLAIGETATLEVYAIYKGNKLPRKLDNSKLTFTSSADAVAEVNTSGVVTGVAEGTANIEIVVTGHTDLSAFAVATVITA